jgi:hypothetical protein
VATGLLLGFTLSTAFLISQRRTALKGQRKLAFDYWRKRSARV